MWPQCKAGRGAGKRGGNKRTGEAWASRIRYPTVRSWGFVLTVRSQSGKDFMQGRGHDSEIICSGRWDTGQGKVGDWEAAESTKPE